MRNHRWLRAGIEGRDVTFVSAAPVGNSATLRLVTRMLGLGLIVRHPSLLPNMAGRSELNAARTLSLEKMYHRGPMIRRCSASHAGSILGFSSAVNRTRSALLNNPR